jgi:hypothetical protein
MVIAAISPFVLLAVLACPVAMGLMMFFMGRGMMGGMKRDESDGSRSLADLKAEQARLAEKIETLETRDRQPEDEAEQEREPVS